MAQFQREVGLTPDGSCGPHTMNALRRLGRKVVGGRPQWLRESDAIRQSGPGAGRQDASSSTRATAAPTPGVVVPDGPLRWTEADLVHDLASRLEGRLAAAGMRVQLTRGPSPDQLPAGHRPGRSWPTRSAPTCSSRCTWTATPTRTRRASRPTTTAPTTGVTSATGERLAGLVQREIVARTGLRDCRTHAKTWDLLRLTRMPAVRVEVGYLTSPTDRARLVDPRFRDRVVEAIVAAVQRMYYPIERDVPTGSIDVSELRAVVAAGTVVRLSSPPGVSRWWSGWPGRDGPGGAASPGSSSRAASPARTRRRTSS